MFPSKLILLILLATVTSGSEENPWEIWKEIKQYEMWGNVSVTRLDPYLYAVSKNNTHISIRSSQWNYEDCDLEFESTHIGSIQVVGIEGKILLIFRQNAKVIRVLRLDPALCLYIPLPSLETLVETTLEPQLIVINNTVDIFWKGTNCLPCRLDSDGNRLEVNGQLQYGITSLFKSFIVKEFIQKGLYRNYVFAGNFEGGTAILMVLDHNFKITKEVYFGHHQIEALAANSDSNQTWIGITYAGLGNVHDRVLAIYTDDLKLILQRSVEHATDHKVIVDTMLLINSTGHSFVNSIETEDPSWIKYVSSFFTVYNSKGDLGVRGYLYGREEIDNDWQVFLDNELFCAVIHDFLTYDFTRTTVGCY